MTAVCLLGLLPTDCSSADPDQEAHPAQTTIELLQAEQLDTVELDKEAYFVAENGKATRVAPGHYQIEAVEPGAIRLLPRKGTQIVTIRATPTRHTDSYSEPVALSVSEPENRVHLVLLLPGGKALDAAGSYELIRSRTTTSPILSPARLHEALVKKLADLEKSRSDKATERHP